MSIRQHASGPRCWIGDTLSLGWMRVTAVIQETLCLAVFSSVTAIWAHPIA